MLAHSIQPIQQFRNTVHKNASDSALIIDAMDLLHSGRFDGFCIVSSDSDFTRSAPPESKKKAFSLYGFGEQHTPKSFVAACNKFQLRRRVLQKPSGELREAAKSTNEVPSNLDDLTPTLVEAVKSCADEAGWSFLGAVGNLLANHVSDFDPRHYGFRKLSSLVETTGLFEIERRGEEHNPQLYVKMKTDRGITEPARLSSK